MSPSLQLGLYGVAESAMKYGPESEQMVVEQAIRILRDRLQHRGGGESFTQPDDTCNYVRLQIAGYSSEVFGVLFLNHQHRLLADEKLFYGTIDGASIHPREVVKKALAHNAAAVIFYHNHPSGNPVPSRADERITQRLKEALAFVDIRVLDHLVVPGNGDEVSSMAKMGLL